jgi:Tfp pilus assembly protein FimV
MPAALNPIKRVWKPKISTPASPQLSPESSPPPSPERKKFDIYGNQMPEPEVQEKNSDSIWDTFDALQAAEAARLAKLDRSKV